MKLFPYQPPPPAVRGWHVPVPKVKLTEIVFSNALIKQGLAKGAPVAQLMVSIAGHFLFLRLLTSS